jgi:Rps23 Pro-64 3,4-dihydroxylase Tpa1-like proline 4-hydroxylase
MEFVDECKLKNINYENYPYPHTIIDNFLKTDILNEVLSNINNLKDEDAVEKCVFSKKYSFTENLSDYLKRLFVELNSPGFIKYLENITGIKDIISNENLYGGGIHRIRKGGYLPLHTDFNSYNHDHHGKLDRRINLLIYMNPDWKEEYNGSLILYDKPNRKCAKKIMPILNRCVIFNTSNKSIHGHPEILNVPEDICRQSIAVYYYTKNTNKSLGLDLDFEGDPAHRPIWYKKLEVWYSDAESNLIVKSQRIFCNHFKINENDVDILCTNIKINETSDIYMNSCKDGYLSSCFWVKSKCDGFFIFTELKRDDYIYKKFENNNITVCFNFADVPVFFNKNKFFKFVPTEDSENNCELFVIDFYNRNSQNITNMPIKMPSVEIKPQDFTLDYVFFNELLYFNSDNHIKEFTKDLDKSQNYHFVVNLLIDNIDKINDGNLTASNRFIQRFHNNSFIDKHISKWIHETFQENDCENYIISPFQNDSFFNFFASTFDDIMTTMKTYYSIPNTIQINIIEIMFAKHVIKPQKQISSNLFFLIVLISVHNPDSEKISFGDGMSYKFNEGDMLIINKCDEYYFQKYTKVEYVQIYIDLCY